MINTVKEIVIKKVSEIRPYFRNPRNNEKTVQLLMKVIPQVGFNVPILIDKNGVIIKGHARYKAAIKLGMEEVPCIVSEADEELNKLDRISDNKISEFTDWLSEGLTFEVDSLNVDKGLLEDLGLKVFDMTPPTTQTFEDVQVPSGQDVREKFNDYIQKNGPQVTDADIQRATTEAFQQPAPRKVYAKVMCEKCGHIMFISENFIKFEYNN